MYDRFNRNINYLRISVTDRCNLRCRYCMPEEGVVLKHHSQILSFDEIVNVVKEMAQMGVDKVRFTGGEPLVRKGIVDLVKMVSEIPGIKDIGMTTNGILLDLYAEQLKQAGLMRVNISLDTLDPEKYAFHTRGGDITKVFSGIEAAKKAGLLPIKINVVVVDKKDLKTRNELIDFCTKNELSIRFIQQMDLDSGEFSVVEGGTGGDCAKCNRLRLTADGFIKPCLFNELGFSIRELGIKEAITKAVQMKPEKGSVCHNHQFFNIGG